MRVQQAGWRPQELRPRALRLGLIWVLALERGVVVLGRRVNPCSNPNTESLNLSRISALEFRTLGLGLRTWSSTFQIFRFSVIPLLWRIYVLLLLLPLEGNMGNAGL